MRHVLIISAVILLAACQGSSEPVTFGDTPAPSPLASMPVSASTDDMHPAMLSVSIEGMTCDNCVGKVYTKLCDTEGIGEVSIDLANKSGQIAYNPDNIKTEDIIAAIQALEYNASMVQ